RLADVEMVNVHAPLLGRIRQRHQLTNGRRRHRLATTGNLRYHPHCSFSICYLLSAARYDIHMVYLSRIYTKTGDDGSTGLGNQTRVPKDDIRVDAFGTVDELNSMLGLLVAHHPGMTEWALVRLIQNDLFDVGADLCRPLEENEQPGQHLRITAQQVQRL